MLISLPGLDRICRIQKICNLKRGNKGQLTVAQKNSKIVAILE